MTALINHTSERFGSLTAVRFVKRQGRKTLWELQCECGRSVVRNIHNLTCVKRQSSCGICGRLPRVAVGLRFGRLVILRQLENGKWKCLCDCGRIHRTSHAVLAKGRARSCGCLRNELNSQRNTRHGEYIGNTNGTPESRSYQGAKFRCNNPRHHKYPDYGGRGIEFRFTSFEQFLEVVGRKPTPQHSLNRINNDGHYEPGNVEWATASVQVRNRRVSRFLTAFGITATVAEWAERSGLPTSTLMSRLNSPHQYCHECVVSLPVGKYRGGCPHHGGHLLPDPPRRKRRT